MERPRLAVGDKVRVTQSEGKPWTGEWTGEYFVAGMRIAKGKLNFEVSEQWPPEPGTTDGFEESDLSRVPQAGEPQGWQNDAVWARFYRDGKNLQQIADEFGGTVYSYSPWLYIASMRGRGEKAEVDMLQRALRRTDEHMRAFADYHPAERTSETEAIIWCNQELLR